MLMLCAGCSGVNCQDALMLVREKTQTQLTQAITPATVVFTARISMETHATRLWLFMTTLHNTSLLLTERLHFEPRHPVVCVCQHQQVQPASKV
jgi:hypothetical protein